MFQFIKHQYLNFCNKEVNWLPSDTEELYLKHLQSHWGALEMNGWINHPHFTYKFNSHGFRSDEFSHEPSVMFLGCSHTVGIGIPEEDTWPRIIAKELKLKCFNLGIGASSNDTAFRLANHYIPLLKPELVIWLSTDISRTELHKLSGEVDNAGPWTENRGHFFDNWLGNPLNSETNFVKNSLAIEYICKQNNIKFLHETADNAMQNLDLARDLMHKGKKSNINCAETFLKLL